MPKERKMNVDELRASLLEGLGVAVTEVPHAEVGDEPTSKVVITAPRSLIGPLTEWLDVTHTGRLVVMTFYDEIPSHRPMSAIAKRRT
jgi:hypothetical protein